MSIASAERPKNDPGAMEGKWQDLVAEASNWKSLKSWNNKFEWGKVHKLDPSLCVFKLLEVLARNLSFHRYDRCTATFNELLNYARASPELATTLFGFLLHACSVLYHDYITSFDELFRFCEQLAPHFKDHKLWRAYVLSLMTLAVRLDGSSEKLAKLRQLNSRMQLSETVTCRESMFCGLASDCVPLVHCGLALQVSLDAPKLYKSINFWDVLELCNGFLHMFSASMCMDYLERGLRLANQALKSCQVPETSSLNYDFLSTLVDVCDLEGEVSKLADILLGELPMHTSFSGMVDVFARLIPQNEASKQLPFLMSVFRSVLREKWPRTEGDAADAGAAFKKLRDLLGWLFSWLRFYPNDKEADDTNVRRDFLEQLRAVEMVAHLYLMIVWMEVEGGTDYCGLLASSQDIRDSWLKPLVEQPVEITEPINSNHLEVTRSIVKYALLVNKEPRLVIEEGVPPA